MCGGMENVLAFILPGSGPMMQFGFAFEDGEMKLHVRM